MAAKVNLDAMIPRADFTVQTDQSSSGEKINSLGVEQLSATSLVLKNLRKPDFQRETNHWTPAQLVTFLKSYVDRELIPSVILWQSPSYIYVIDGAHRLSALRAWIEDDYGDGTISHQFYSHSIPEAQKRVAKRVRRMIEKEIGSYRMLTAAVGETEGFDKLVTARASIMASRSFSLQWVEGDAEKAETSFFKINTQGTPLHKTEERLLRQRRKPIAIAARSIVRAGTGNKYWSKFEHDQKDEIEDLAKQLHVFLFQPEFDQPIKTLDLPLGGSSSPIEALNLLMDMIEIIVGKNKDGSDNPAIYSDDIDGSNSISTLKQCMKVFERITGNKSGSLGLHPAVYFYNHRGKHSQHMFLAVLSVFSKKIRSNDKNFFKTFTSVRHGLEQFLIEKKPLIGQAIVALGSNSRVPRLIGMFEEIIPKLAAKEEISSEQLLKILKLQGKLLASDIEGAATQFNDETKSEIFLRKSLESAMVCPICKGYIDTTKSASYDHVTKVQDGGVGVPENGQITHPFCNSGIKG